MVYAVQVQHRESRKLVTNGQSPLDFLAEAIAQFIYIKFYHRANHRGKYADGLYHSFIDSKVGHIPLPSVRNGSGPGLRVWVCVGTDPFANWWTGSSLHANHQFGYGLMDITQLDEFCGLPAGYSAGPSLDSNNALVFAVSL